MHLLGMKHYRVTSTGRRIAAESRARSTPDTKQLIALVLHIADELHAEELDERQRRIADHHDTEDPASASSAPGADGGNDDDTHDADPRDGYHAAVDGGDVSAGLDQGASEQGRS
ncbi:hypothetical protein GCM10027062_06320 [Nocardioides hungaricus]